MQMDAATALRTKWGAKPCPHPEIAEEFHQGARTGDHVCKICGASFTLALVDEILAKRRNAVAARPNQNPVAADYDSVDLETDR